MAEMKETKKEMKPEVKAPEKSTVKTEKKEVKAEAKTETKKTESKKTEVKKTEAKVEVKMPKRIRKVGKTPGIRGIQQKIKGKWKPDISGRFGKRVLRSKKKAKWAKWRKPAGIDILRKRADGYWPTKGLRTPISIRGMHPIGMREVMVANVKDLRNVKKNQAVRISAAVGMKKKIAIINKINEMQLIRLN